MLRLLCAALAVAGPNPAPADVLEDIGYDRLVEKVPGLGHGASVAIAQIEAIPSGQPGAYFPDTTRADFAHIDFLDGTGGYFSDNVTKTIVGVPSGHATSQAVIIASDSAASMTPGIARLTGFEAIDWIDGTLIDGGRILLNPVRDVAPVNNHSWVGTFALTSDNVEVLERIDWLVDVDDQVHVMATRAGADLIGSNALNVLHVRHTASTSVVTSEALSGPYVAGRSIVDITVPESSPSRATSRATSAVALLVDSADPGLPAPEVVRAVLMAGAVRKAANSDGSVIDDWRETTAHRAGNGLDFRFGAGQLYLPHAFAIVAGGPVDSAEDGGVDVPAAGYDYDEAFGGPDGSNRVGSYRFSTGPGVHRLAATLAWNAFVADGVGTFDPAPRLADLDLALFDTTDGGQSLVAGSFSDIDSTENLWTALDPDRRYLLRVSVDETLSNPRPYALAWRIESTPSAALPGLPPAAAVGLIALLARVAARSRGPRVRWRHA